MVTDTVTVGLQHLQNAESVRIVVLRAAAEEHVVVHVFSDTFVPVERMKLPSSVEFYPQFVNH